MKKVFNASPQWDNLNKIYSFERNNRWIEQDNAQELNNRRLRNSISTTVRGSRHLAHDLVHNVLRAPQKVVLSGLSLVKPEPQEPSWAKIMTLAVPRRTSQQARTCQARAAPKASRQSFQASQKVILTGPSFAKPDPQKPSLALPSRP